MMKAIFFDRDDTIILDKKYLSRVDQVEFFKDTIQGLKIFDEMGYKFFMITNQSGIARGYFSADAVINVFNFINQQLKINDISEFIDIAFCPHVNEDQCQCRKPKTGMLEQLCSKHDIKLERSFMVGNHLLDYECGTSFGVNSFIINNDELAQHQSFKKDLLTLAKYLKNQQE